MSDILGLIDDTLDNWHGSRDAMHWTPDGGHEPEPFPVDLERLWRQTGDAREASGPQRRPWRLDPAVWPHRDYILDLSGIALTPDTVVAVDGITEVERLRIIEGPLFGPWRVRPVPEQPKRLDARYRQRQKNRRRRR